MAVGGAGDDSAGRIFSTRRKEWRGARQSIHHKYKFHATRSSFCCSKRTTSVRLHAREVGECVCVYVQKHFLLTQCVFFCVCAVSHLHDMARGCALEDGGCKKKSSYPTRFTSLQKRQKKGWLAHAFGSLAFFPFMLQYIHGRYPGQSCQRHFTVVRECCASLGVRDTQFVACVRTAAHHRRNRSFRCPAFTRSRKPRKGRRRP